MRRYCPVNKPSVGSLYVVVTSALLQNPVTIRTPTKTPAQSTTTRPRLRAVPSTILQADSSLVALVSGSLRLAISCTGVSKQQKGQHRMQLRRSSKHDAIIATLSGKLPSLMLARSRSSQDTTDLTEFKLFRSTCSSSSPFSWPCCCRTPLSLHYTTADTVH